MSRLEAWGSLDACCLPAGAQHLVAAKRSRPPARPLSSPACLPAHLLAHLATCHCLPPRAACDGGEPWAGIGYAVEAGGIAETADYQYKVRQYR